MTLTMQQIFDKAAVGLLKQGARSLDSTPGTKACVYRGPNGLKCGIGFLIPDEHYNKDIEGFGIYANITENSRQLLRVLTDSGVPKTPSVYMMMHELQDVHDSEHHQISDWKTKLTELAGRWELNTNAIEAL